ncbi:MAG: metal ABC transporter ATP-binding protein [Acidimicrobiales bacterium]
MSVSVRAADLSVGYRGSPVVAGVDVALGPGDALALVGSNGSGKSTVLRTVVGLLEPIAGTVAVTGSVGYLGQTHHDAAVLPLRARDVVHMGRFARLGLLRRPGPADRRAVARAMDRMGCDHLADQPFNELSGGQRQRVRLAQALAAEADVLVVDEPTAGIDAAGRERWLDVVAQERSRGAIVVSATHDIGEATRCSQVLLLAHRVVASGPPPAVLTAEHLLAAFGIALAEVDSVVVASEEPHHHDH